MRVFDKILKKKKTSTENIEIKIANNIGFIKIKCLEDLIKVFDSAVLQKRRERDIESFFGDEPIWYYTEDAIRIMANHTELFFEYIKIADYEALECITDLLGPIAYYMGETFYDAMRTILLDRTNEFPDTQFEESITYGEFKDEIEGYYPEYFSFVEIDMEKIKE